MKKFLKENVSFFVCALCCIIVELVSTYLTTGSIIISRPWFALCSLGILFSLFILFRGAKWKKILLYVYFLSHIVLCLVCVSIFENTETFFDYNMLLIISETVMAGVGVKLNFWFIGLVLLLFVVFVICTEFFIKNNKEGSISKKLNNIIAYVVLAISIIGQASTIVISNRITKKNFYNNLYIDFGNSYSLYGTSSAFVNELYKMAFFRKYKDLSHKEIEEFIYKETTIGCIQEKPYQYMMESFASLYFNDNPIE